MQPSEQVKYFVDDKVFILKLIGTLRFTCAPYIDEAFGFLNNDSLEEVIIDMTETNFLDSTILGTMIKFFLPDEKYQKSIKKQPIIVYKNDEVKKTFYTIGFDKFFSFQNSHPKLNKSIEDYSSVKELTIKDKSVKSYVQKAHQVLSELEPSDPALELVSQLLKE